jgi:2-iminoacetate synthase
MFSKYFNEAEIYKLLKDGVPNQHYINLVLAKEELNLEDLAVLVRAADDLDVRNKVVEKAIKTRKENWNDQLFLMPPLYISNGDQQAGGCLDSCLYCPWHNKSLPTDQILQLTPKETYLESHLLLSMGYGDIELVSATDAKLFKGDDAGQHVRAAKIAGARNVGINFFPLKSINDYRELRKSGVNFAIVWQETYHRETYEVVHPRGPKSNMSYRLDAHDRALRGGIDTVGVAFLGGLYDWRFEVLATIEHALYLKKEYEANIIFGMPRRKKSSLNKEDILLWDYGDNYYEFVGALYSLAVPESLVWFSTREAFELSAKCVRGGGCIFTLDCSTEVGGYSRNKKSGQFPVYSYSFEDGVKKLCVLGFKPQIHLPW